MSQNSPNEPNFDSLIDQLLSTSSVAAPPTFAAQTLARMKTEEEGLDALIDQQLIQQPLQPAADFSRRTLRRLRRERWITQFSVPLAAAAAVMISVASFWTPGAKSGTSSHSVAASADEPSMQELVALAQDLTEAAPLLDPNAPEALSQITRWAQ